MRESYDDDDDFLWTSENERKVKQRRPPYRKLNAESERDKLTSRRCFYLLAAVFVLFLVVLVTLIAVHLSKTHMVPVDPLHTCDLQCATSADPCEEWDCFVVNNEDRCMLWRKTTAACSAVA